MTTGDFMLLADADKEHVEEVCSSIKQEDDAIHVVIAHDGKEALDAAMGVGMFATDGLQNKPLFVLVDLNLPKLNGHVVLQLLRKNEHGKDVPIIAMVASTDETLHMESSSIGATEVVPKPISTTKMAELIERYRPKR